MIRHFTCKNFRNINCEDLKFEKINILIGPNNAGKTNFIRALSFAANMVNNQVKTEATGFLTEVKRNGWNAIADRSGLLGGETRFKWDFELKANRLVSYALNMCTGKRRDNNYISYESLDNLWTRHGAIRPYNYFCCHEPALGVGTFSTAGMTTARNQRIKANVDTSESVLLQMDTLFFSNKQMFSETFVREDIRAVLSAMREYFEGFYSYSCAAFNITEIRELQDELNDGHILRKDGANFANVFAAAMQEDENFLDRYHRLLHRIVPNCNDIQLKSAGGKVWVELDINGMYFPLSEVSDGTVHLLLLLLMLSLPAQRGLSMLAVDEPEMNLHPAWQKLLAHEFLNSKSFKQCFISTHSSDLLDEFTEGFLSGEVGVFTFDPTSRTPIRKLQSDALREDLQEWTLGDLYRIGDPLIGGWPQ